GTRDLNTPDCSPSTANLNDLPFRLVRDYKAIPIAKRFRRAYRFVGHIFVNGYSSCLAAGHRFSYYQDVRGSRAIQDLSGWRPLHRLQLRQLQRLVTIIESVVGVHFFPVSSDRHDRKRTANDRLSRNKTMYESSASSDCY